MSNCRRIVRHYPHPIADGQSKFSLTFVSFICILSIRNGILLFGMFLPVIVPIIGCRNNLKTLFTAAAFAFLSITESMPMIIAILNSIPRQIAVIFFQYRFMSTPP